MKRQVIRNLFILESLLISLLRLGTDEDQKNDICEIILQTGGLWDSIIQCKELRDKKMQNPSPHQQIEKTKINGSLFCESA